MIKYGLLCIASTLKVLSDSGLIHGNVCVDSIYVTKSGEWRLCGLDYISGLNEENAVLPNLGSFLGSYAIHVPPEIKNDGWTSMKRYTECDSSLPTHTIDSWAFGCLIFEIFNGIPSRVENLVSPGAIPANLLPCYKALLSQNPKNRLTFTKFLDICGRLQGFFDDEFVKSCVFLDEIALKSPQEKEDFVKYVDI